MIDRISSKAAAAQHWRGGEFIVALLAGLVLRLMFLPSAGYVRDLQAFRAWTEQLGRVPLDSFYATAGFIDYTPGYLLVLKVIGEIAKACNLTDPAALNDLLKVPAVLCDLACAVLVFALARRFVAWSLAFTAALFVLFNPGIIVLSAGWGQVDSVPAAFMLGSLVSMVDGMQRARPASVALAWVFLAVAAIIKPAAYLIFPLYIVAAFAQSGAVQRARAVQGTLMGVGFAALAGYAIVFPFHHSDPFRAAAWLFGLYAHSASVYPVTSANAFSIWAINQAFMFPDSIRPFMSAPFSEGAAGLALLVLACACILVCYWRARTPQSLVVAAMLLSLAFFVFPTRMHERYLFNAVVLAQAAMIFGAVYRTSALLLSFTFAINLLYSLYYAWIADHGASGIVIGDMAPLLTRPLAVLNLSVFLVALWYWGRRTRLPTP